MDNILKDSAKIKIYTEIQGKLCDLEPNASDEKINEIINLIPPSFLNQKEDLMKICQFFSYIARNDRITKEIVSNYLKKLWNQLKRICKTNHHFFGTFLVESYV